MIHLFDKNKTLIKSLPMNRFKSAHQVNVLNGLYHLELVTNFRFYKRGVLYNYKTMFDNAAFVGHFDHNDRFQLYKLDSRKLENNDLTIIATHIFFDEAKAGTVIHNSKWKDSELRPIAQSIFAEIGWDVIHCDVTERFDMTVMRETPMQFRNASINLFEVEYDYEIGFDGQHITSKGIIIRNRLGSETGKRYAYGSNVLKIVAEQDDAEVYTAVIGRGKGEEIGDGYGAKIEFTDVEWKKSNGDPVDKPLGQNYVEIPEATTEYGYRSPDGTVKPRFKVVEFDTTEDPVKLLNGAYKWAVQNSVPKAVFESEVYTIGNDFELGDSVGIIYKEANIVRKARVEKVDRNLQDPRKTKFDLGDYRHFVGNTMKRTFTDQLKRLENRTGSALTAMKNDSDAKFNAKTDEINNAFLNAKDYADAEVQASEVRMSNRITNEREALESEILTAKTEAVDSANDYSNDVESRLNTSINTQRTEIESAISTAKTDAISQAESDATQKASAVQNDLETYKQTSQQRLETLAGGDVETVTKNLREVISDLESKVGSIEFGETKESLQQQLDDAKAELDELEIGGRNIVPNSNDFSKWNKTYSGSTATLLYNTSVAEWGATDATEVISEGGTHEIKFYHTISGTHGKVATWSIWIKNTGDIPLKAGFDGDYSVIEPGFSGRMVKTVDTRNSYTWVQSMIRVPSEYVGETARFVLWREQVEFGNTTTDWQPSPEDTEQKITTINESLEYVNGQLSAKLEQTDIDPLQDSIVEHTAKLEASAESIGLLQEKNELHEGDISTLQTNFETQAGEVSTLLTKTGEHETKIADITANYEGISASVGDLSDWKSQKGSVYDQTADAVNTKVWSTDISEAVDSIELGGRNLARNTKERINPAKNTGASSDNYNYERFTSETGIHSGELYTISGYVEITEGSFEVVTVYEYPSGHRKDVSFDSSGYFLYTFQATSSTSQHVLLYNGSSGNTRGNGAIFKNVKLEKGNKATDWTPAPEDTLQHTDFELRSDGFLLGTTHVGGEDFATAIVGNTAGMSMIADNVDFSNNITVQNQIKSWSIESVKADFAEATIDYLTTGIIKNAMLDSEVVSSDKLLVNTAMVDKFIANTAFINDVKALSVEAAKGSFGDIVAGTADLQFIENKHLATESVDADKLLVDSALVNKLTVNTAFISDIKAMSIEAVEADISSIRSQILTSNVILSEHINASIALIDKLFSEEAYISALTSKSIFARDINAIEVTANSAILHTMMDEFGNVAGGLSIRRPDGAVYINNGVPNHSLTMQRNEFRHPDIGWTGQNYYSDTAYYKTYENIYAYHDSRYLTVAFGVALQAGSPSASAYINVRVREFSNPDRNASGTQRIIAYRDQGTNFNGITLDLGVPTYQPRQFYLEFCFDGLNSSGNIALVRTNRAVMRG